MTIKTVTKDKNKLLDNQMVETQQMRCPRCNRFIGFQAIIWGIIKIKCPNCKEWITYNITPND
jgi:phage FluMu protein Com